MSTGKAECVDAVIDAVGLRTAGLSCLADEERICNALADKHQLTTA